MSVFENDCLRTIVGVSHINHIRIGVTKEYLIESLTLSKRKGWSGLVMWDAKTMLAMSTILTRTALQRKTQSTAIKSMEWWPNKRGHKANSANGINNGKRQDEIESYVDQCIWGILLYLCR